MLTIINVKETLADALIRLSAAKPISKITVQDIVDECNTSRRTFYNHFHDKYELINWIYESKTNKILDHLNRTKSFEECLIEIYTVFLTYKNFFLNASAIAGQNSFADFFYTHTKEYFISYITDHYGREALTEELLYSIEFNASGQVFLCLKWIRDGMTVPVETMARYNIENVPSSLKKFLV